VVEIIKETRVNALLQVLVVRLANHVEQWTERLIDIPLKVFESMLFMIQGQDGLKGITSRFHIFIQFTDASLPHEIRKRVIGDKNGTAFLKKDKDKGVSLRGLVGAREFAGEDDEETDSIEVRVFGGPALYESFGDCSSNEGVTKKFKSFSRLRIGAYYFPGLSVQLGKSKSESGSTDVLDCTAVHFLQKRVFREWSWIAHETDGQRYAGYVVVVADQVV
jgi:hypothetical protein